MEPISPELIQKFLRGDCTKEEEHLIIKWYSSFDNQPDPYKELSVQQQAALRERMLLNIQANIQPNKAGRVVKLKHLVYAIGAAAVVLLFFVPRLILNKSTDGHSTPANDKVIVVSNRTQTIYKQTLPDNSTVWLSPGAQISYHRLFGKNLREVKMTGESFFEVTKDKQHPFVIYSNHIITRVWGTSFRVTDHKESATAEVAVVTGKVSVKLAAVKKVKRSNTGVPDNSVMLLPKQRAVYKQVHNSLLVSQVKETSSLNMWQKTTLSFDKVPLGNVLKALNKEFKVEIVLEDKTLSNYVLQADFNVQNLPDIMEMLKKLLKLTYVTDGKKFMLQKGETN